MAASVNNIAATFAAASGFPPSSSSSPPPQSSSSSPAAPSTVAFSASPSTSVPRPIIASWNPHLSLPRSYCSSLLTLHGLPGRRPHPLLRPPRAAVVAPSPVTVSVGDRLPEATLFYLDRSGAIQTVSLAKLTRAREAVIMAVSGTFAPPPDRHWCQRGGGGGSAAAIRLSLERLVKEAGEMRAKGGGAAGKVLVACVAANDVHVMRAWGEQLGAAEGGVMMLSDPKAQMARALGIRSDWYVIVAVNGMVRGLFLNHYDGHTGDSATAVDDVLRVLRELGMVGTKIK